MKKLIIMFMAVAFLFTACQKEGDSVGSLTEDGFHKNDSEIQTKMIAGGGKYDEKCTGIEVGTITVSDNGTTMTVTYTITSLGWTIEETHLYVGPEEGMPATKNGNPKNGHFPYTSEHNPGVTSHTFEIPTPDGDYIIAAHADVSYYQGLDEFCEVLPESVEMDVMFPGTNSLFDITISDGAPLIGEFESWCIDVGHSIDNTSYFAEVYCSYDDLPVELTNGENPHIDNPGKLNVINWIVNQQFVGQPSSCDGNFTWGDVQWAIWDIIDNDTYTIPNALQPWSQCRIDEILELVEAAGDEATEYEPEYGDLIVAILVPENDAQVIIATLSFLPGEYGDETAWGYGYCEACGYCDTDGAAGISFTDSPYYGGNRWGWYFYGFTN
jgi:hypothetical protein